MIATHTDLFSEKWHDHDEGKRLPCTNANTLKDYLLSDSALEVKVFAESSTGVPAATIKVIGPRCDDGRWLWIEYRLNKLQFNRLPEEDKDRFRERLRELMDRDPSWRLLAVVGIQK